MVKIRLARFGSKKRPYYHIVVTDSQSPRDGSFMEQIGTYDPGKPSSEARIDTDRLAYWKGVGAGLTPTLAALLRERARNNTAASA